MVEKTASNPPPDPSEAGADGAAVVPHDGSTHAPTRLEAEDVEALVRGSEGGGDGSALVPTANIFDPGHDEEHASGPRDVGDGSCVVGPAARSIPSGAASDLPERLAAQSEISRDGSVAGLQGGREEDAVPDPSAKVEHGLVHDEARDGSAVLAKPERPKSTFERWMRPDSRSRRAAIAFFVYAVCVVVFAAVAGRHRLTEHTAYNHYAHLADAWLHGRQDLRNGPPPYAMGNDFAEYQGKTYISFPPFPAVLMLPFVAASGSPEEFRDGQFMIWLAGVGPGILFLVLEKLRRSRVSPRTERENLVLSLLFAFGTVYFFTSVEGTVWFAAHVVGVGLVALYLLYAIDAERPFAAGLCLACSWMTRPSTLLVGLVFAVEALRIACDARGGLPAEGPWSVRLRTLRTRIDLRLLLRKVVPFAIPIAAVLMVASAMNYTRFGNPSPTAFGHEHLSVAWRGRIQTWGLFGYHYLPKNLGVMLTVLPWRPPQNMVCYEGPTGAVEAVVAFAKGLFGGRPSCTPFKINEHGLALWFTTPLYFWLFRRMADAPRQRAYTFTLVGVAALLPCAMDLLYQNSGWRQFGYRFSNDYAILLFVLLAVGGRPMGRLWKACAVWSVAWNLFGAATFDRADHERFYFRESSQSVLYQSD